MNERQWWGKWVKPAFTDLDRHWLAMKVQNYNNPGFPDAVCCFNGHACLIETKFLTATDIPARDTSAMNKSLPSPEQARHLAAWVAAGGNGYVLVGLEPTKQWFVFPAAVMVGFADRGGITRQAFFESWLVTGDGWRTLPQAGEYFERT